MIAGMASVAVVGAGAIGGVLAALAYDQGHDVTVGVRTPFPVLRVRAHSAEREVGVRVATDPAVVTPVDWLLVTTKAHDTASAAPWLRALSGPGTVVVVIQNGLAQETRVAGLVDPSAHVLPGVIVLGAEALAPGLVVHHGYGRLTVPAGPHADALADVLGPDVVVDGVADFRTAAWRKLISNAIANPITALVGRRNEVLREPFLADLVAGLGAEVIAVARADGADVSADDLDALRRHYADMPDRIGTSMLYDRMAGRALEHEYLTGAVVATGARHGVPTPLNDTLLALLRGIRPDDDLIRGAGADSEP